MTLRPALRAGLRFENIHSTCVILRSETDSQWLYGRAYPLLVPMLDGRRSALEIAELLKEELPPEEAHYALAQLELKGLIAEPCPKVAEALAAFWHSLGVVPLVAQQRLAAATVGIAGYDAADRAHLELRSSLESWGIPFDVSASITVFITSDYRDAALALANREAIQSGRAWMLVNPLARTVAIGPLFRPGVTACWACLAHRLDENHLTLPWPGAGAPCDSTRAAALSLASNELAKWIALDGATQMDGSLLTIDMATLAARRHVVVRRPQCAECGTGALPRPVSRPFPLVRDSRRLIPGETRVCRPDQTLAVLEKQVSPITGIVAAMHEDLHQDGSLMVTALLNGPLGTAYHRAGREGNRLCASGKGITATHSRVSCLAEAVERYSICFRGDEPSVRASYRDLDEPAVDPALLAQFSEEQYRTRESWNRVHAETLWLPEPYDPRTPIHWVAAWSLHCNAIRWMPAALCYLDSLPASERRFFRSDSNGCAAGNTIEEAILQGFFELVERDAIAIWWYNRVRRPECRLETFSNSELLAIGGRIRASGRAFHIVDLTTDLNIPVFGAISPDPGGGSIKAGFGAHLDARIALRRAVTELEQALCRRSNRIPFSDPHQPQIEPCADLARGEEDYRRPQFTHLHDCLCALLEITRKRNLEVLVLDITRPEIGFPVVRVIVPGLRHHRHRFAPGRLYTVPVELGWLDSPLGERAMNPVLPPL